jgi:hypothetical protein
MPALITKLLATEYEIHKFAVEASSLGLAPGEWPERLETDLGNGQPFRRISFLPTGGFYRQEHGCIELHLLND